MVVCYMCCYIFSRIWNGEMIQFEQYVSDGLVKTHQLGRESRLKRTTWFERSFILSWIARYKNKRESCCYLFVWFFRLPGGPAVPRLYVTQSQRRTKREGGKNPGGELSPSGFKVDPLLVRNELITPISRIINPSYIICFWPFMIRLILLHV